MSDPISQEMIDALIAAGAAGMEEPPAPAGLASDEVKFIQDFSNLCMDSGVNTLLILLNVAVTIAPGTTATSTNQSLGEEFTQPVVAVEVPALINGKPYNCYYVFEAPLASAITDLMMGGDGSNTSTPIDELQLSAVSEAVNQMVGSAVTSITTLYSKRMDLSPPSARYIGISDLPAELVRLNYHMNIEGVLESDMMVLVPMEAAQTLLNELRKKAVPSPPKPAAPPAPKPAPQPAPAPAPSPSPQMAMEMERQMSIPPSRPPEPAPEVKVAQFAPLVQPTHAAPPSGLDLILDVPMKVTVELGRTKMQVRQILELSKGSLIELDKLAGEPVDLFVNGKLIARGEVVVIDENFGVRVLDIVNAVERIKSFRE